MGTHVWFDAGGSLGYYLDRTIKGSQILGQKSTFFITILIIILSTNIYLYLDNFSSKIDAEKDTLEIEIVLHYFLINRKISYVFLIETLKKVTLAILVVNYVSVLGPNKSYIFKAMI